MSARAESLHRFLANLAMSNAEERRVLHFYFSPEQRRIVLEQLLRQLSPQDHVVLGCPRDAVDLYRSIFVSTRTGPHVTYIPVTEDWHRSVCNLLEEALRQRSAKVIVLADFGVLVKGNEVEGLAHWLESGLRGTGATAIAQFEGAMFSEALLRRPIRKSSVVLFDGFYCMPTGCVAERAAERVPALADDSEVDLARD